MRNLARARTLTTLEVLGPDRKRAVVKFLYETSLINKDSPVVPLSGASLRDADLSNAELSHADLSAANLSGADLSGADLHGAIGITNDELEQQAGSLKGATMPNGQKYEEWLKSKGRGEHGENGDPS